MYLVETSESFNDILLVNLRVVLMWVAFTDVGGSVPAVLENR